MIIIPLTNDPKQNFNTTINEVNYDIAVKFNSRTEIWSMDMSTGGEAVVTGLSLVGGVDLLRPYRIGFRNMFMLNFEDNTSDPTFENLGTGSQLVVFTDEEFEEIIEDEE